MIADFGARFDSFYSARYDLRLYNECESYRHEGDGYRVWEPMHEVDIEPEALIAPGAMSRIELDDWDSADIEEF